MGWFKEVNLKYLIIGDVHQAVAGPGSRKDTWPYEINEKLEFISLLAKKHKCDAILSLGDVFHIKNPARNPHWLVQSTHDALTAGDVPVVIVEGNHDQSNDRAVQDTSQPLGTLGRMRGIELLTGPSEQFPEVFAIPYLQDWQELPTWFLQYNQYREKHPEIEHGVIITHAPIFPDNKTPPYEHIAASDVAKMTDYKTLVAYGHIHDPEGIWTPVDNHPVQIANYGAISRGSLHKETMKRQPKVYIFDTKTGKHRAYNVPVKPVEEVFDLDPVLLDKERTTKLTTFLDGIESKNSSVSSTEELLSTLSSDKAVPDEVQRVVAELLDFAESN